MLNLSYCNWNSRNENPSLFSESVQDAIVLGKPLDVSVICYWHYLVFVFFHKACDLA
jgi:hypothetical protein